MKKSYHSPQLTVYGPVSKLTEVFGYTPTDDANPWGKVTDGSGDFNDGVSNN